MTTDRMALAEALTDASRSLDRTRRRLELVERALAALPDSPTKDQHITRCRTGVVELEQLNNAIRRMNT